MQDSDNILLGNAIALTPINSRSIDLTTRVLHALVIYPRGLLAGSPNVIIPEHEEISANRY